MNAIWWKRAAALGLISWLSCPAFGQYVWLNEQGIKQYSDMPPPPSVPASRILKAPGGAQRTEAAAPEQAGREAGAHPAVSAQSKEKAPMTIAERNAEFQKRRMEQAEKEKKEAAQEKQAAAKAKNCQQARSYQQALQSGDRIARRDGNGERYFISDEQRAQEVRDTQKILDDCK